ncbi:hypothetical protein PRZ48_010063 [Zasmidium cellare]|uniref:RING-type domain-containing protein n=1 Tax=Zasmidium cellare TaxID=395010 RepID=A0ABR0EDH7_ZASCE|nr:hypothetical protein PRZ48_010063 [Zasmidium cellare]
MDNVPQPRRPWKSKADFFRPFRTAAAANAASSSYETTPSSSGVEVGENISTLYYDPVVFSRDRHIDTEPDLRDLNNALVALVDVFPDVQPEVLREMLLGVSEESRLQVVTEHLLQKKAKWVGGRYRTPASSKKRNDESKKLKSRPAGAQLRLENEDMFRSDAYKKAVKQVLYQEFRSLSHSTIKGVLAEQNFSYTFARPVLQQVASRSWRFSISNLWSKRSPADAHPYIMWQTHGSVDDQAATPAVRRTGSVELDHELYELFVEPIVRRQRQDRIHADYTTACEVNEAEAEDAEALFDCECCYSSVPFEKIATCDDGCHYLCLDCIRRTVNEALYGQGWARAADLHKATVRCFAPLSQDCQGSIPSDLVRRSLTQGADNDDAWRDFQARVTTETLLKSGLPLQRCPLCSYAEVDEPPSPRIRHPKAILNHISTKAPPAFQIMFIGLSILLAIFTLPVLVILALLWILTPLIPPLKSHLQRSLSRIHTHRRGIRFQCQNPTCTHLSCTRCLAPWTDPHTCFSTEKQSLRTAIETSTTHAIKRTCPRCLLSFVKSSGCNKLVCNCGYTMCYICRQEITSKEGYGHFCQHFRPNGGRCGECERCDLYGDEDEEVVVRRAAEEAERKWREEREGDGDEVEGKRMIEVLVGGRKVRWWEEWLDWGVDAVVA